MLSVHVFVHVKPADIDRFIAASVDNARNSRLERGVARFDVLQQQDDPARFLLVEVYRSQACAAAEKETEHYRKWRDTVAGMMAEPRTSIRYESVFPPEQGWSNFNPPGEFISDARQTRPCVLGGGQDGKRAAVRNAQFERRFGVFLTEIFDPSCLASAFRSSA